MTPDHHRPIRETAVVFLKKHHVLILCLLGSVVRLLYGYFYTPWRLAPDHLAWDMLLEQGSLRYDHLIYYPHEGGSVFVSLLAHSVRFFTNISALAVSAAIIDFVSRYIQLWITHRVFGSRVALLFGLWTILAAPVILPWGTVNFGLHSLSAFFPFVLLYLLWLDKSSPRHFILCGLFLGFSFWFSYSAFVLVAVFFLFHAFRKTRLRALFYTLPAFTIVLLAHLALRQVADPGFHLEEIDPSSIRNTEFMLSDPDTWEGLRHVWTNALAQSFVAHPDPLPLTTWLKRLWLLVAITAMAGIIRALVKGLWPWKIAVNVFTILLFVAVYSLSPFYYPYETFGHYMSYRHLTYIMPFISLIMLAAFRSFKFSILPVSVLLFISVGSAVLLFRHPPSEGTAVKAAGWALAYKMGHDPEAVFRCISTSRHDQSLLIQGMGWGMSTALFNNVQRKDAAPRIERLNTMMARFPKEWKHDLVEGVKFSFSDEVTPGLHKDIQPDVLEVLGAMPGTPHGKRAPQVAPAG